MSNVKCPKCGSELEIRRICKNSDNGYVCKNNHFVNDKEYEQLEYQRRLDNVLKKFDKKYSNGVPYKKIISSLHIPYFMGRFSLRNNASAQSIIISLNTVESLLADLEEVE